jgi:hypothetical protein
VSHNEFYHQLTPSKYFSRHAVTRGSVLRICCHLTSSTAAADMGRPPRGTVAGITGCSVSVRFTRSETCSTQSCMQSAVHHGLKSDLFEKGPDSFSSTCRNAAELFIIRPRNAAFHVNITTYSSFNFREENNTQNKEN